MTHTADIHAPNMTPALAKRAAAQLALFLQARLLDAGVAFEEAAKAACRALPALRDAVGGAIDLAAVVAVDLGDERGGQVQIFADMHAAEADRELNLYRHVAVQVSQLMDDVQSAAQGNVINARRIN